MHVLPNLEFAMDRDLKIHETRDMLSHRVHFRHSARPMISFMISLVPPAII